MNRGRDRRTRTARAGAVAGQAARIIRTDGVGELGARLVRRATRRLDARPTLLPVFPDDLLADPVPERPRPVPSGPLTVNWVMTPPSPGSGGHTTIFRVLHQVEALGHTCNVPVSYTHLTLPTIYSV